MPPLNAADGPGVGVQVFQWPWSSIADECPRLHAEGYDFVQTSPPTESIAGPQWWTAYQPVSYRLESKFGTRSQFVDMVHSCRTAGVDVVVDAVLNHMANPPGASVGVAGSAYAPYDFPGIWTTEDFHHCTLTGDGQIHDYHNAAQVQTCALLGLNDLATERPEVQRRLRAYLDDLRSIGVRGLRIDAAKHIAVADLAEILRGWDRRWILSEVIRGDGEPITPEEYTGLGKVAEFGFARELKAAFAGGHLDPLAGLASRYLPSGDAVSFVDNHDTERNGETLSLADDRAYRLANVYLLGIGYGTPVVLSGYRFQGNDDGPPMEGDRVAAVDCSTGPWTCWHRDPAVLAMFRFRCAVGDAAVSELQIDGSVVAWSRGDRGFVAQNTGDQPVTVTLRTALAPGTYCDLLVDPCGSMTVTSSGTVEVTLGSGESVAVVAAD